jgi:hypothetical protein
MIDTDRGWHRVQERLDRTTDPRHRLLLDTLRDHLLGEATGDFEMLMGTLGPDPQYHFGGGRGGDFFGGGPKGYEAVKRHYESVYEENRQACQYDITRMIVDNDTIMTEGEFKQIYPGRAIQKRGLEVDDPDAAYMVTGQLVLIWPYDADGQLTGEDSYGTGGMYAEGCITKVEHDDLPPAYFDPRAGAVAR